MSFNIWYRSIYPVTVEADIFKLLESSWEQSKKEEREANIRMCERIYFEANAPLSKDALNCAIAIRGRTAAPKDEVIK